MLPAVGQGALVIEIRSVDHAARVAVEPLDHPDSHRAVLAERALLAALDGGCLAPVGAWARREADGLLRLDAAVLAVDGRQRIWACHVAPPDAALSLGADVARRLIDQGAKPLVAQARATR
jgi:hydroxymethylbilane synthase